MGRRNKRKNNNKHKSGKKIAEDSEHKPPPLSFSSGTSRDEKQASVPAAVAAKPHLNASGTGAPPLWESVFGNAWFWDAGRTIRNLQQHLTREGCYLTAIISAGSKIIEFARQSFTGIAPLNDSSPASLQDAISNKLHNAIREKTTPTLHQVKVCTRHGDWYDSCQVFSIGNPQFRHQARHGRAPKQLYMEKADSDLVLLYCSASGSGKTAELAASAYSRDAAFSIQLVVDKDIPTAERSTARRREARISLKKSIHKLVDQDKSIRDLFVQIADMIKHRNTKEDMVRIVVAIDEAGSQPNLINEIIRDYKDLGQDLAAFIMTGCNNPNGSGNCHDEIKWINTQKESLRVVFSIAGTCFQSDTQGSLPDNFEQLQPIAQRKVEDVYNVLCREYRDIGDKFPPFQQLPEYPLLSDIVHHNSRMTSALVFQLATTNFSYRDPRHQVKIISTVFEDFCTTSGMESLWKSPHACQQVVASAYAALLFQQTIKVSPGEDAHSIREKVLNDSIHFQHFGENRVEIHDLIGKYGLLTIASFANLSMMAEQEDGRVEMYPFLMDPAMQRLCSWMIAGGEVLAHPDEALETTPFAYEALAVQFLSNVTAAATTVEATHRKDLKSMLEDGAAMYASEVRDGDAVTSPFVDKDIAESWEGLRGWYPVAFPSEFAMKGMYLQKSPMQLSLGRTQPQQQQQQQVQQRQNRTYWDGLKGWMVERNNPDPPNNTDELRKYAPLLHSDEATLTIDKDYLTGLWDLRNAIIAEPTLEEGTQAFHPPIASVAEGNSNLADGYVSVVVAQKEEVGNKIVWKNLKLVTICIQAKGYTTGEQISNEDIRNTKDGIFHELLRIPFGNDRVYCVASGPESLVDQTMSQADADAAESERDRVAGDRAVADALGRERYDVIKAAFREEIEEMVRKYIAPQDQKRVLQEILAKVEAKIEKKLEAIEEEARNAATAEAEADETHLAPYIAMPIGKSTASKALADTGIHCGGCGKTKRFGVQLKYSST